MESLVRADVVTHKLFPIIVLGCERIRKCSKFKAANMVLQIIPGKDNFDFHRRD
jgi:hypothetical protein